MFRPAFCLGRTRVTDRLVRPAALAAAVRAGAGLGVARCARLAMALSGAVEEPLAVGALFDALDALEARSAEEHVGGVESEKPLARNTDVALVSEQNRIGAARSRQ